MTNPVVSTLNDSEAYELQMGRWSRKLAEPFLDFAGVAGGETILDAGCGTGSLTFAIPRRSKPKTVVGIDRAAAFIEFAKSRNTNSDIEFCVANVCKLPFPGASFDRVMSMLVLHFVPDTT